MNRLTRMTEVSLGLMCCGTFGVWMEQLADAVSYPNTVFCRENALLGPIFFLMMVCGVIGALLSLAKDKKP